MLAETLREVGCVGMMQGYRKLRVPDTITAVDRSPRKYSRFKCAAPLVEAQSRD